MSFKVAVSQRVDVWAGRAERRDAVDQRLCQWLIVAECIPFLVPNILATKSSGSGRTEELQRWLHVLSPDAILLSGGNDIGQIPERDDTERFLLTYAQGLGLPVLGICRGMQMMAVYAGGGLVSVSGHVGTRHRLHTTAGSGEWPAEANSFHNLTLGSCPPGFAIAARADDGSIEAIRHQMLPWEGWMWHPEREREFNPIDVARFRLLLTSGAST